MNAIYPCLVICFSFGLLATGARAQNPLANTAQGHPTEAKRKEVRTVLSISPAELFFKQQASYERVLNSRFSVGLQVNRRSGPGGQYSALDFAGWQAAAFGRQYFRKEAPYGSYYQGQLSIYQAEQALTIYRIIRNQGDQDPVSYRWKGTGLGLASGIGYRAALFPATFGRRLVADGQIGIRVGSRPQPTYDTSVYESFGADRLEAGLNWYAAGPASILYGTLTLGFAL